MATKVTTDAIYRAVIEAAGHCDHAHPPDREAAFQQLVTACERRALPVSRPDEEMRAILAIGEEDAVMIAVSNDTPTTESEALLRRHRWQRLHVCTFGQEALSIRTATA